MAVASNYGVGAGWAKATPKVTPKAPKATAKVTPKQKSVKVLATPITTAAQDAQSRQKAIQTLRADDVAYFDMLNRVPVEEAPMQAATETPAAAEATPWTLEGDPVYQAALASGQSSFNFARNAALSAKQNAETNAAQTRRDLDTNAAENRRRLAGNYAARGLAGGAAGVLTMAEAQSNARQVADRTSIADQISALNQDYLANYGATGSDWTGTLMGQQYKTQAAQAAIQAQLARYGVA